MVSATVIAYRKTKMEKHPTNTYNQVSSVGKTIPTMATATGYLQDDVEKYLGLLVDDGLVARATGQRMSATYSLA